MKAYKTWSQKTNNPTNIPGTVASEMQECTEIQRESLEAVGYTVVSDEDYEAYLLEQAPVLVDWQATQPKNIAPVTNQQLRTALVMISYQQNKPNIHPDAIRAFIEQLPEPNRSLALQQWEYSNEMLRNNPMVNSLAGALGLSSSDLDGIWLYAATLTI